jgi:hypothetical protein
VLSDEFFEEITAHPIPTVAARLGTTRVTGNAQPAAFNRQVAMYLAKHVGGWSTTRIGKFHNGRDHSTVCYALKRIEALRQADSDVDATLANLTNQIRSAPRRLAKVQKPEAVNPSVVQFQNRIDDEILDALAERIVERLQARGLALRVPNLESPILERYNDPQPSSPTLSQRT